MAGRYPNLARGLNMDIIFTNTNGNENYPTPAPSSNFVPEWYKKIESYMGGEKKPRENGSSPATVKRCMPVFDAITAGYMILTPCDLWVEQRDGKPYFIWLEQMIDWHPIQQTEGHPISKDGFDSPKFMNPWAMKTPKGYSTLIVHPMHQELPFTILPGIVDTDGYIAPVNFPFKLNDPKFEGMIPQGTPMAQVIPFKRESWKMSFGNIKDVIDINNKIMNYFKVVFFDRYRNKFWHRKEYK